MTAGPMLRRRCSTQILGPVRFIIPMSILRLHSPRDGPTHHPIRHHRPTPPFRSGRPVEPRAADL